MSSDELKRLFFAFDVSAPWPTTWPRGKVPSLATLHWTLAFLGTVSFPALKEKLSALPSPPLETGVVGFFDSCLFLPPKDPHVVAWHMHFLECAKELETFQKDFNVFLEKKPTQYEFLPHVTLARAPFSEKDWKKSFQKLPFILKNFVLYESFQNSQYVSLYTKTFIPPFEELSHTADLAFHIYGSSFTQLYLHAQIALSFYFPPLLDHLPPIKEFESLCQVIMDLNEWISNVDISIGCPFKAISFHDRVAQKTPKILEWEMIIDV